MNRIKKGDEVIVIAGKDKGKRGQVQRVLPNGRLLVSGVNMVKKHVRANPNRGIQGGIVQQEAGIHASNVAIWNAKTQKADRVGVRFEDGKKVRFFKSNGEALDA